MWYVIHTVSGAEEKCMQQCRRYVDKDNYQEFFIPQYIVQKHFKQEWHEVRKTLFPGYLFVDTENIEPIMEGATKVRQYTRVLRDGEMVSPITQEEEDFLMAMMDCQHIVRYSEGLVIGEKVYITTGPLKNYEGYIKTIDRHRRVAKLEVPIFGRLTPVEVGFGALARVSEKEFRQMVQKNIQEEQENVTEKKDQVKVLKGIFQGMAGRFLYADIDRDEWTVELKLFGAKTKVVFHREEIQMFI